MLKIDRYIFKEMIAPFLAGTTVFLAVILANLIIGQADDIFSLNVAPHVILTWLFYQLPSIMTIAIPVGAMLATSLVVIRLGRGNEIVPLRLGGMSVHRFFAPFYVAGFVVSLLDLGVNEFVAPAAIDRANQVKLHALMQEPMSMPESNATFQAGGETYCHVGKVDLKRSEMHSVLLYKFAGGVPSEAVTAGLCTRDGKRWRLQNPRHTYFKPDGSFDHSQLEASMPVDFPSNLVELWDKDKQVENLTIREYLSRLSALKTIGDNADTGDGLANRAALTYYLYTKFTMPLSCLIFAILAAPLSFKFAKPRSGPFTGVLITIIVVFFANGTINWARVLTLAGSGAWFTPFVGAWIHVFIFGAIAAALTWRAER